MQRNEKMKKRKEVGRGSGINDNGGTRTRDRKAAEDELKRRMQRNERIERRKEVERRSGGNDNGRTRK